MTRTPRALRTPTRPRRSRVVVFPLIGAILLFGSPAIGFVLGDRATPIDNRPLAEFPTLNEGWKFLPKFQAWSNDYLPLRAQAVRADTTIAQALFGETPRFATGGTSLGVAGVGAGAPTPDSSAKSSSGVKYPQVLTGKDGWLFYGSDVEAPCTPKESLATIMKGFQTLSDAATKSGRKLVIVIAPDKSSAHPELMPDSYPGKACMAKQKTAFWKATSTLKGVTLLDPKLALASFEKQSGRPAWRKLDSQWAPEGAAVFATELAKALQPSLLGSTSPATLPRCLGTRGRSRS